MLREIKIFIGFVFDKHINYGLFKIKIGTMFLVFYPLLFMSILFIYFTNIVEMSENNRKPIQFVNNYWESFVCKKPFQTKSYICTYWSPSNILYIEKLYL